MKNYLMLFAVLTTVVFTQCNSPVDIHIPESGSIVGCWINPTSGEDYTITVYERAPALADDGGYCFNEDGTLVQRKNVGFCGTPPITYGNFDGTWILEGSDLMLTVDGWMGVAERNWELVSVDAEHLKLKYVD